MGSFDRSYYDILNRYENVLKEGMNVRPVYYRKVGNTYTPIQNNMDLARINPTEVFVSSGDPTSPYVPYAQVAQQAQQTQQGPTTNPTNTTNTQTTGQPQTTQASGTNQPSISMTGNSAPQSSTSVAGQRVQTPVSPQQPIQQSRQEITNYLNNPKKGPYNLNTQKAPQQQTLNKPVR